MEIDPMTIAVIIILLIIGGIFIGTQMSTGNAVKVQGSNPYTSQYGGSCGR